MNDGPNAGLSATADGSGRYTLSGLTFAGFTVSVEAPTFLSISRAVPLTAGVTTTTAAGCPVDQQRPGELRF